MPSSLPSSSLIPGSQVSVVAVATFRKSVALSGYQLVGMYVSGWPQSIGFLFRNEYVVGWFFGSSIYSRTTAIVIETIGKWGDCLPTCFHHILYLASKWPSWFVLVETTNLNQNAVLFLKDWNINHNEDGSEKPWDHWNEGMNIQL